ncbi:MAG: methylglyoxal synthase, partial [Cyanobacteria bacterium J06559_1]
MPTTLAFTAHDSQKDSLVRFVREYEALLSRYQVVATGTTGGRLQQETALVVYSLLPGAMGGDVQIAAQVAEGEIAAVVCLADSLNTDNYRADLNTLLRICQLHNVPI